MNTAALAVPAPSPELHDRRRRVLIVGDPPLARGLLRTMLSRLDYLVSWAPSAAEADASLRERRFDLALIALRLPDVPGLAFARRLAEGRNRGRGPAIIVFGDAWDSRAVQRECQQAGVSTYLEKPISFTRLMAAVGSLAQSASATSKPNAMPTPGQDQIDSLRFASFTQGDPQLERELGALFVSTAEGYIREMAARSDSAGWSAAAHALKGASANIGATHLARLAGEAEKLAPDAVVLEQLRAAFAAAASFFQPATSDCPEQMEQIAP